MGDVVRGLSWLHGALAGWLRAGQSDNMADTRFDISRSLTLDLECNQIDSRIEIDCL